MREREAPTATPPAETLEVLPSPLEEAPVSDTTQTEIDTSSWKTYRNEEYGFVIKYPSYLERGTTLFQQPFDPGLSGEILTTFSDQQATELVLAISGGSLDWFVVRDNIGGVSYRFSEKTNSWISSVESAPAPTQILGLPFTAYKYESGDGRCSWQGAVVPHPKKRYVLELLLSRCTALSSEESQKLKYFSDLVPVVRSLEFGVPHNSQSGDTTTYRNEEFGFQLQYPQDWAVVADTSLSLTSPVVAFVSPQTIELIGKPYPQGLPANSVDISVYYFANIQELAPAQRDLVAYLESSPEIQSYQRGEFNGYPAFEAWGGGHYLNYLIFIPSGEGIFEIVVERTFNRAQITEIKSKILASFRLL